ncbi:hypothetical protein BTR23_22125 [Alkalihalophilus pseudofirmus]|nr:hypothetical protein BTR23_22125 [Alkalihalophilus pseudofirmus]
MDPKTSTLKEKVLSNINKEIYELIDCYETEIQKLREQIQKMEVEVPLVNTSQEEMLQLKQANKTLSDHNDILYDVFLFDSDKQQIKQYLSTVKLRHPEEAITIELTALNTLIQMEHYDVVLDVTNYILIDLKGVAYLKAEWLQLIMQFIDHVLDQSPRNVEEMDGCYLSALKLWSELADTTYRDELSWILDDNSEIIISRILDTNEPKIITQLARCCLIYELNSSLLELVQGVIDEWEFLDANVNEDEFLQLLWYAAYVDMDAELIEKSDESLKFMNSLATEMHLYHTFHDVLKGNIYSQQGKVKMEQLKDRIHLFNNYEKELLFEYIDRKRPKSNANPSKKGKSEPKIKEVLKATSDDELQFKWPSTEVNDSRAQADNDLELNSKSELRKLGYQITGLTRVKRWEILENKAVPELGLKKVAYTIAYFVRGRKSMKNGEIKNRNSITEWEYDLNRLKEKFYNHDFSWPSTKVK